MSVPVSEEPPTNIPTQAAAGGDTAATFGVLRADPEEGCFWLDSLAVDGPPFRISVAWPPGFHARWDPPQLLGPDGTVVAEPGDEMALGGGRHPALGRCMVSDPGSDAFGANEAYLLDDWERLSGRGADD